MPDLRNIWSSLADTIKGVLPTRGGSTDYRSIPEPPSPKARSRAKYSIVIMSESGAARQIKLTKNRIRLAIGAALAAVVIILLGFVGLFSSGSSDEGLRRERDQLANRVETLEEENHKLQMEQSVKSQQASRVSGSELASLPKPNAPSNTPEPTEPVSATSPSDPVEESNQATSASENSSDTGQTEVAPENPSGESEVSQPSPPPAEAPQPRTASPVNTAGISPDTASTAARQPIINFDARNVIALRDGNKKEKGKISFRLIKDQTDVPFSGYLFIILELVNRQGNYKILCYPKARLGPEDMPEDFRDGKELEFKSNKKFEIPYRGTRLVSSLSRLSVLVYGEDGNVVYQRGFERDEVKFRTSGTARNKRNRPNAQRARHAL